jgi:hypothetical protein
VAVVRTGGIASCDHAYVHASVATPAKWSLSARRNLRARRAARAPVAAPGRTFRP